MKHQRGKVSKPRGLVQRLEQQADKEVKSWSPSQANSDLLFLFSTTYLSPLYKQNHFPFYKHVRRGKEKNSTIKRSSQQYAQTKTKTKKHEHEHQSKKEKKMRLPYSITLHQASNINKRGQRGQRIAMSEVRGLYIYIYSLQAKSTSNFA